MSLPVETFDALTMTGTANHVNSENNIMTIFLAMRNRQALSSNREQERFGIALG
jgi:hypothetical protein